MITGLHDKNSTIDFLDNPFKPMLLDEVLDSQSDDFSF